VSQAPGLTTERLTLRAHRSDDLQAVAAMAADPAVMRHLSGAPSPREDAWRRMLCGPGMWALLGYGYWIVERRSDGEVIGQAGLADFKRDMEPGIEGLPELGYILATAAHGQGYASEAVAAVLGWADERLRAQEIAAIVLPENRPSIRVLEKAGFGPAEPATYRGELNLLFRRRRP
jgi:RimJ/RimL family protein N-acetyltransferase